MTSGSVDSAQRKAATIAGLVGPLSFVTVVAVNFGILQRLVVGADAARTARNILEHETLFRLGLAGNVLYCAGVCVLAAALYVILEPVGRNLALLATLGRLVHGLTWLLSTLNLFTALRLVHRPEYAGAFSPEQLQVLARLHLSGYDAYYVGLLFWSAGATAGAWLWLRSGYIPRALAGFGALASAWCAVCAFALFLFPDFPKVVNLWWFDSPMALFEIALSFLLLFRGLRAPGARGSGR